MHSYFLKYYEVGLYTASIMQPIQQLVNKLIPEVIGREIEKATQGIYPLQNVRGTS